MASLNSVVFKAVTSRVAFQRDFGVLEAYCKTNKVKADVLRPVVMNAVAVAYNITIEVAGTGKEMLDSKASNYEAARKCMGRIMQAAFGGKAKANANADPVVNIVKRAERMTKPQIKRLIARLEELL